MRLAWGLAESAFGYSLESGGQYCIGVFGRNMASVAEKMYSSLIFFIKKCHKCTFNTINKNNAAINFITVKDKV
jgi:hypothetical protein